MSLIHCIFDVSAVEMCILEPYGWSRVVESFGKGWMDGQKDG